MIISIHAPAKGATRTHVFVCVYSGNFNPRSREGSDLAGIALFLALYYFNPRSREGSDARALDEVMQVDAISIHAPAKGAT